MITVLRIYQSKLSAGILERLFPQEHIRAAADPYFYTYAGRHELYRSIETGTTHVYGCFTGGRFRGVILGKRLPNGLFYAHFFLLRGTDGWKFKNAGEDAIIADYAENGEPLTGLTGYIPEKNRGMIMAICRANREGKIPGTICRRENGYFIYRREI